MNPRYQTSLKAALACCALAGSVATVSAVTIAGPGTHFVEATIPLRGVATEAPALMIAYLPSRQEH